MSKKDDFFKKMEEQGLHLTYNDVRLETQYSEVLPHEVDVSTYFSRNVPLNIPVSSSPMDSVTEHKMAIAMAKLGGIGVLHKGMSMQDQVSALKKVKFYLNGLIEKPIAFNPDTTLADILRRKEEKQYGFSGFPIVDEKNRLVGLISGSDFEFYDSNTDIPVKQAMRTDVHTAPKGTTIQEAYAHMKKNKVKILPLLDEKVLVGMYVWSDVRRIINKEEIYNVDANNQLRVAAAVGVRDFDRVAALIEHNIDALIVDSAHGNSKGIVDTVKRIKKDYGDRVDVIAGNISEPDGAYRLIKAGVDGLRVGQGPGSICTTRVVAGIGSPQVTAVYRIAQVAKEYGVPVIADGGLQSSGDIVIALAAGAQSVMMGSMLSGMDESPGEIIFKDGKQWKVYRGMGSLEAMEQSKASRERYGQLEGSKDTLVPEGIVGLSPYKGSLGKAMHQYVGGLRSGMGYNGARTILQLAENAIFFRITNAGLAESHPHDVTITKDAPNYRG